MNKSMRFALALALLLPTLASAAPTVSVLGLFSGKAPLSIDGWRQTLALNRTVGGSYAPPGRQQLRVAPDAGGMYRTAGSINGVPMSFLVDTGASAIALNSGDAARIGIDYRRGTRIGVRTASGKVGGYELTLDKVTVGGIEMGFVKAIVLEGSSPHIPLLGMSFLGRLNMRNEGSVMVLEKTH